MERLRGCFNGYGGPIFSTKADRIMSRYRPIAPKPALPCSSDHVERSTSSALSFDNLRILQVPDVSTTTVMAPCSSKQKSRRVRKRLSKDVECQQPAKRHAMDQALPNEKPQLLKTGIMGHGFATDAAPILIQEDAGFMERAAAASVPSSVFPRESTRRTLHNNNCGYGGCFTEMIRGIAGLPTANRLYNLLQQQQQQQYQQQPPPPHQQQQRQHHQLPNFLNILPSQFPNGEAQPSKHQRDEAPAECKESEGRDFIKDVELCSDVFLSCFSEGGMQVNEVERAVSEEPQRSGLDEEGIDGGNDQRKNIVTLNLLPELPKRADSPTLSTCSSESSHASAFGTSFACIEQVYGPSSEPVILTDDMSHKVLWVNQGYSKACRDNSNMLAPFIDPLGVPTQLGRFQLQVEGQGECTSTTLWGFLKKFVVDMANRDTPRWLPSQVKAPLFHNSKVESHSGLPFFPQKQSDGIPNPPMSHSLSAPSVITPQPIRLVGSVVSVENVTEVQKGDAITVALELVKKQLEEGNLPGFITDASNVVRWVNTAYKAMVGQPECPWLVSTVKEGGGASPTITGEVLLSCNVEVPRSAVSFSGRANVQWTRNAGERSCMTLPCDVSAFISGYAKRMLVWRFDIEASLSLTCGAER